MSRSHWNVADTIVIALVGLMALFGLGLGLIQSSSEPSTAGRYDGAEQHSQQADDPLLVGAPAVGNQVHAASPNGIPAYAECATEQDAGAIKCRDLKAQEGMANAAVAQLFLTGLGLILVLGTLIYTRDAAAAAHGAVREAENATKAAEAAVRETRRIGETQVRAYVHAMTPTVLNFVVGKSPIIKYRPTNHGQTPAHNFRQITTWRIAGDPDKHPFRFGQMPKKSGVADMAAGQYFDQTTTLPVLTQAQFDLFTSGKIYLVFAGVIRYRDVFGRHHRTLFRRYMDMRTLGDDSVAMSACSKNNRSN